MTLEDIDRKQHTITVRLKGARDEHRVPVTDDFWPLLDKYLSIERRSSDEVDALWIAARKGRGKPLCYASFESSLRYIAHKVGIAVHPHLFRHTLAQGVLDTTGNIKVAQEILGHSHLTTTADLYMKVDHNAMVSALVQVKTSSDRARRTTSSSPTTQYVFAYDEETISELERAIAQAAGVEPTEGDS
jgi:site-specific recombinase XerC